MAQENPIIEADKVDQLQEDSGDEFTWRAHPARERLANAIAALMFILAFSIAIFIFSNSYAGAGSGSYAWAGLAFLVLLAALNRFFFPSTFHINSQGITARYLLKTQKLAWKEVRRFILDRHGGYLSTRAVSSRLDPYRGMHILFGPHREAVIKRIRAQLAQGEAAWEQ